MGYEGQRRVSNRGKESTFVLFQSNGTSINQVLIL